MAISDVLHEAVVEIDGYRLAEDEVTVVRTFMDALRCAGDLPPGEFGDPWHDRLVAKIREAAPIAEELSALKTALHAAAAQERVHAARHGLRAIPTLKAGDALED